MLSSGSENSTPGNGLGGSRTKPSRMSFSAQLELLQKSFAEGGGSSAAASVPKLRDLIEGIPKPADREKGAVYAFKDLLTVFGELEDGGRKEDQQHLQALLEALRYLIGVCREAEEAIRCHFVLRIYNLVVKFGGKEDKRHIIVQCACLLEDCHWAEEHTELFLRVSRVVLKAIYDAHARKQATDQQKLISSGLDVICSTTVRLLRHWSESDELAVRAKALAIYGDVFDNSTALLYRVFSMDQKRAGQFFEAVIDVFRSGAKFSEAEMAELFRKSLPYLEIILSLGEASKQYLRFVEVLGIFEGIKSEPTASSVWILRKYLSFQNSSVLDMETLKSLSEKLKVLSGKSPPDQLLVEVVIFITLQLRIHLDQIKQQASEVAEPIIDLCKSLVKFGKYCPRNHAQICSRCGSSGRHFVDYISTMVISLAMSMSKAGQEISPELVGLVNGFLRHKMLTLDELSCDKKQSLMDSGLRFLVNWIRVALQLVPGREMLDLARLVVEFKYRHGFDFLTDIYLIRLVENCLKDAGVCQAAIDIKLVKLLAALRDGSAADDSKDVDETIYAIVNFQLSARNEPIRDLTVVDLLERPEMDRFGFPIDPTLTRQEKASILLVEINLASRYKNSNIVQYFQLLRDMDADPLRLGMAIYLLQDGGFPQLSQSNVEVLKTKILQTRPRNPADKVRRHGALALLGYYAFSATSKATISKLKEAPLNRETIKNDQINNVLKENTMEQELILLTQLEDTYANFREMVSTLAESSFQHFGLIYSLNQISSMLDNTCRFFVINYFPLRAVETQLLNYLLVSQKPDRILELCCSLGFLIENHHIYNHLLSNHYRKPWVPTLAALVEKATEIITSHRDAFPSIPESRKYHFLNLYLSLSLYEASRQNLPQSIVHLQSLTSLLEKSPPSCPITSIARGRIYHTLFRLITVHNLPTPRGMSPRNFIRLMLGHYNELQKLPPEHGFIVSTSTLEMTVETVHYLTLRYDTDRLEAHVEQLMRFVLRRGAGLRAMQLMALYAAMSVDSEKEDKCRMLLTYLDRLLLFRPLETDTKNISKESTPTMTLEVPLISLSDYPNYQDPTRKAVKYVKSPTKRSPSPRLFPDQAIDFHQYLIEHHNGCSCQFCRYPQYKCQALLVAASYARLAFIKGQTSRCQEIYEALAEHWRLRRKDFLDSSGLIGQRDEFTALVVRAFLSYGHLLSKVGQLEQARREYDKCLEILKEVPRVDLGLIEEVRMNLETLEDLRTFNEPGKVESKFSSFEDFVKDNPRVHALPSVELGGICSFTPRVGTTRFVPKTASRTDGLLKQVARKRLKTTLAKDYSKESELISAMSGLSCASERKPRTVSVFVDTPEKPAVPKGKKKLFTQETCSEDSPKKRGRRKKAEGETPAAPKSTRKKRIPLSPSLKTSSSNESFKDILAKCSTPVSKVVSYGGSKGRTTASKRPKLTSAFPKLTDDGERGSPEMVQNHSFNSSFRDVLMQSLNEDAPKRVAKDSSVIVLDDSEPDVINSSLAHTEKTMNHSVDTTNGCLSLKKYSDRKVAANTRTQAITAKTRLQFDTSAVIDITTPDQSPCIVRGVGSSPGGGGDGITEVVKRTTRGRPRLCRTASSSSKTSTEVTPETSEVPVPRTTRKKVRGRRGE